MYVFSDASHLVNLLLTYLLVSGLSLDGKTLIKCAFMEIIQITESSDIDLNIAHKVIEKYLNKKDI